MIIDSVVVDYTLTLTAANITGVIEWNGAGDRSTPSGLSWIDSTDSWTLELALSRPVNLVVSQTGLPDFANEPQSIWTVDWDSAGQTTISDPADQLGDPVTNAGAGTATFSSTTRLLNGAAVWAVSGPDSATYVISWQNPTSAGPGTEAIGFSEMLSTLGTSIVDTDGDGVDDSSDNCSLIANDDQRDTNGDGFGNVCDPDLNNDGIVNVTDLGIFRSVFFASGPGLDADFNGDNTVNVVDLGILRVFFFMAPGPSGAAP